MDAKKNLGLRVAAAVFALVAVGHLLRLLIRFELAFGGRIIPLWANALGLLVAGGLAIWLFHLSRS